VTSEPRGLKRKAHREAVREIVKQCLELLQGVESDLRWRGYQFADREAKTRIMTEISKVMDKMEDAA
jgi:hypothetical protein